MWQKYSHQMPHMPHIQNGSHKKQVCEYIYLIWTQYYQQCDKDHQYRSSTPQYWHVPLNNMSATVHMYVPLHCNCSLNMSPPITGHNSQKQQTANLFTMLLPYMTQQQICPSNVMYKPYLQITQCTSMGKTCQIYATYDLAAINDVARNVAHRWQWQLQKWRR